MLEGRGDSPQLALDNLDPERITLAREMRCLTKIELAEKIGKTPSAISQIERNKIKPDIETFVRMSLVLGVPTTFFMLRGKEYKPIDLASCHFRAKRKTSQIKKRQSARKGELLVDLIEFFEGNGVLFPEDNVSPFSYEIHSSDDIETAASSLRKDWGMGYGPIPNIIRLVESKGVTALPLYFDCEDVDAYSTWKNGRPCMMLSLSKSASRARVDVAHELAHLILHEDYAPGDSKIEAEAYRFGTAFLAPRESFLSECPRRWNLEVFMKLKFRWKMSIQALVRRAKDLGRLPPSSYRKAFIDLTHLGMRKNEGDEWEREVPSLISQAIDLLKDKITLEDIANALTLYPAEAATLLKQSINGDLLAAINRKAKSNSNKIVTLAQH